MGYFMKKLDLLPCFSLSALTLAMFSPVTQAETTFDLRVSYYDSSANSLSKKEAIENNIRNFADGLYEASNGAHKLGKVTIFTDGAYKDNTDILWVEKCHPNANTNGRGKAGSRIEHCDKMGADNDFLKSFMQGGFIITHEWGHFTYSLLDEYQNKDVACNPSDPGGPCATDTPVEKSIMNNTWAAASENNELLDANVMNFSTPLNATTSNTAQFRVFNASGWATLSRPNNQDPASAAEQIGGSPRVAFEDLIAAAPKAGQTPSLEINSEDGKARAKTALSIEWKNTATATPKKLGNAATLHVAKQLVIDQSQNIGSTLLEELKSAAQQIIEQAEEGDMLGVISFADSAKVVVPLTTLTASNKKALLDAVKSISLVNKPAALGDALKATLSGLQNAKLANDSVGAVYLFADGFSPLGAPPLAEIENFKKEGVTLYSFALNNNLALKTLLSQLANKTRGESYSADTSAKLNKALQQAQEAASPNVDAIVATDRKLLTTSQEFPFYMDASLSGVAFTLNYLGNLNASNFSIVDASGKSIALSESDCLAEASLGTDCEMEIENTGEGLWKIKAQIPANTPEIDVFYSVLGIPKDNNNAFFANVSSPNSTPVVGQTLTLQASVEREFPITGIAVNGTLEKPDGSEAVLTWKDDGVAPDRKASDGIYSAAFKASSAGEHYATVIFDNQQNTGQFTNAASAYAPAKDGSTPKFSLTPVNSKFTRTAITEIDVQASADGANALADYERTMNWGEAVVSPALLPPKGRQILDIAPYKVRYYPETKTYLGYRPDNKMLYIYNVALYGNEVVQLGELSKYFAQAKKDGF